MAFFLFLLYAFLFSSDFFSVIFCDFLIFSESQKPLLRFLFDICREMFRGTHLFFRFLIYQNIFYLFFYFEIRIFIYIQNRALEVRSHFKNSQNNDNNNKLSYRIAVWTVNLTKVLDFLCQKGKKIIQIYFQLFFACLTSRTIY